jgi:hypothetical protein
MALTEAMANEVYDVLVKEAGAPESMRRSFLQAQMDETCPCREYRFCGELGFGGKFWANDGRMYVTCYREDETKKRARIIERVNGLLEVVQTKYRCQEKP